MSYKQVIAELDKNDFLNYCNQLNYGSQRGKLDFLLKLIKTSCMAKFTVKMTAFQKIQHGTEL